MSYQRFEEMLSSPEVSVRLRAIQLAAESSEGSILGSLIRRLGVEPEPQVRRALVESIGRRGSSEGLTAIRSVARDSDSGVRCCVLQSLFRAQDESVFPLAVVMLSDLDPGVKQVSFQILRRLGKGGILKIIGRMLMAEAIRWRVSAVAALGQIASEEGISVLSKCLRHETNEVRLQAKASLVNLAKHGNATAAKILQRNSTTDPTSKLAFPQSHVESSTDPSKSGTSNAVDEDTAVIPAPTASSTTEGTTARPSVIVRASTGASPRKGALDTAGSSFRPGGAKMGNYVPLDEDSIKVSCPSVTQAHSRQLSTAKYKALFGESRPKVPRTPPPEPNPEESPEASEEAPAEVETASEVSESGETKRKGPKTYKDFQCRECQYAGKLRPDKQKMAPMRLWCGLLKKETSPIKNCPRGRWPDLPR